MIALTMYDMWTNLCTFCDERGFEITHSNDYSYFQIMFYRKGVRYGLRCYVGIYALCDNMSRQNLDGLSVMELAKHTKTCELVVSRDGKNIFDLPMVHHETVMRFFVELHARFPR